MPPKGAKKAKESVKETDTTEGAGLMTPPGADLKEKPKKAATPRKKAAAPKAAVIDYRLLPTTMGDAAPVSLASQNGSIVPAMKDNGRFGLKLEAEAHHMFTYITTTMLTEGEHAGKMAVILQPAKPFPIMKLTKELRGKIFDYALAPQGFIGAKVVINTLGNGGIKGKDYGEGLKYRLGLMRANKEILDEARNSLYSMHFKFDDTVGLNMFLIRGTTQMRRSMKMIEISVYRKPSAMSTFSGLAECVNLSKLHISQNVATNSTPTKAAKAFYNDAGVFLKAMGTVGGNVERGVHILKFGRSTKCFSIKDGDETRAWDDDEKETFQETLKALLK